MRTLIPVRWRIRVVKFLILAVPLALILTILRLVLPEARKQYARAQFSGEVHEFETEHFLFYSRNAENFSPVSRLVEDFHAAFYQSYEKRLRMHAFPRKPQIWMFADRDEFLRYHKKHYWSDLPNNAAYYDQRHYQVVLYWTTPEAMKYVLYHELTHLLMDMGVGYYNPEWTPWFGEGVAGYFERCEVISGQLVHGTLAPSLLQQTRQTWLPERSARLINLLITATGQHFEDKNNAEYYNKSYLLVYFLLHGEQGKYREKFLEYFEEERKDGPCPPHVFWQIIGEPLDDFGTQFSRFLHRNS
jgi:hypothetical protein